MKQRDITILWVFVFFNLGLLIGGQWTCKGAADIDQQLARCRQDLVACSADSKQIAILERTLEDCAAKPADAAVAVPEADIMDDVEEAAEGADEAPAAAEPAQ